MIGKGHTELSIEKQCSLLPGVHTSKRNKDHKVYPYLLRELEITRKNQVWATDITYIPMKKGFLYFLKI